VYLLLIGELGFKSSSLDSKAILPQKNRKSDNNPNIPKILVEPPPVHKFQSRKFKLKIFSQSTQKEGKNFV
jgi:hypothetical protein